jgi:acetoacetate decarboxylase
MVNKDTRSLLARERYWRRRIKQENEMQRMNEPVSIAPPSPNWQLVAKRQVTAGGKAYPCGAIVPVDALGRNLQAMLDARFLVWSPPSNQPRAAARELPTQPKAKPHPRVEIMGDGIDAVADWKLTKQRMTERCGGNSALALDLLMSDVRARELFKIATRIATAAEAKKRKMISVPAVSL